MELGGGAAERDKHLGRHQQHRERRGERHGAGEQAEAKDHGDESDAESGEHVEYEGGQEGDAQRGHGGSAQGLAGCAHLAATPGRLTEGPQCREALDQLEVAAGEGSEGSPLPPHLPVGLPAEVGHAPRDQREEGHEDQQRRPVHRGHPPEDEHRDRGRQEGLREVATEVAVECLDATGGGDRELAGALGRQPDRPQTQRLVQERAA